MKYSSVTYSRKSAQNYDYESAIYEKLYNHAYFLKGKPLLLQVSGQKRQTSDRLNVRTGILKFLIKLSYNT